MATRFGQFGAFMMARALLVVGILVLMLVVPVYLKKERENRESEVHRKELEMSRGPSTNTASAPAVTTAPPRPIGHGLSLALLGDGRMPSDVAHLGCHGEPAPLDQPHQGSCNPYRGDTSCRTVLPVLCVRPAAAPLPAGLDAGAYPGWTGGTLGATQPVMGAVLESAALASARCEKELGAGWRMAAFHDGPGGQGSWGLQGLRGAGLTGPTRYWVHIGDQKGNCWDSGG
jgi:hypothetical protein